MEKKVLENNTVKKVRKKGRKIKVRKKYEQKSTGKKYGEKSTGGKSRDFRRGPLPVKHAQWSDPPQILTELYPYTTLLKHQNVI